MVLGFGWVGWPMPLWLDRRYINLVSPKLSMFKWKKVSLANFRCPYCNDSAKNKRRARGYFYTHRSVMMFKCHNCDSGRTLATFLRDQEPSLFLQYQLEAFQERKTRRAAEVIPPPTTTEWEYTVLPPRISLLPPEHYARKYIEGRLIPEKFYNDILFVANMDEFVKQHIDPDQESPTDAHIVILIHNTKGKLIGCNGRSMSPKDYQSKYCKAKIRKDEVMIYGAERVDTSKKVFVFEGEFDSMFVENAVAVGGINAMYGIENELGVNKSDVICVIDKDQRNREVIKSAERLIDSGYAVVLFPGTIVGKDVNDFVIKQNLSQPLLQALIDANTYSGLRAKLALSDWRKIR